jgi:hypothetical protein
MGPLISEGSPWPFESLGRTLQRLTQTRSILPWVMAGREPYVGGELAINELLFVIS